MKQTIIITLVLVAILSSHAQTAATFSFEKLANRHDANGDGMIAKSEFKGNPANFDRFDFNQDGEITKEEFETGLNELRRKNQKKPIPRLTPEGVTAHRDLLYATEDGLDLKLDLYLPANTNTAPPLMVWIHGGGWKNGDKANVNPAILQLATDGYAVASINYRLKDLTIHPKNIHDCKGAVRWLRAHAKQFGYDPKRVAVGGGSAGGHLALLLGLSSGFQELEGTVGGNSDESSSVSAIVDFYGPSDLFVFSQTDARFNNAHEFLAEQLKHASPLTYLSSDDPPVLIFHGDKDKTVPVEQSKLVHERYQQIGLESHLNILEGAGHGGRAFSDEVRYQQVKAFLDQHLQIN